VATQAWSRAFGAFVKRRERAAGSSAEFSFHWLSVAGGVIGGHSCRSHAIRSRRARGYSETQIYSTKQPIISTLKFRAVAVTVA
jgi:hypothetical protein